MRLGQTLVDGVFLERPNRYLARVLVDGRETEAHVPDPGRLPGLMIPQRAVRLIYNPGPKRKTDYTLALVRHGSIWVSAYPVFANALVEEALEKKQIPEFKKYQSYKREAKQGDSRFDFLLERDSESFYLEVKSVSWVEGGVGMFPDAPTLRGVKHLRELIALKSEGYQTGALFVSQRSDACKVVPQDDVDPRFGEALRDAAKAGVQLLAYNCKVTNSTVTLDRAIPVEL
ncbi:MAG: DNA/RNA nuclease SfsA [Candidatus Nitrohelix vancouverensis]|uniref:Sugar fermentation stimulation protein homolog n=1 Tax=Candidatus Nitrohelix vancouverensis TaxID=2705534 RepID=A0A7T0C4Y7_9BACT|nr:MAG: DNA/RNA nuclease SfsA [Candidatus Nitrohelix vancouverensis]